MAEPKRRNENTLPRTYPMRFSAACLGVVYAWGTVIADATGHPIPLELSQTVMALLMLFVGGDTWRPSGWVSTALQPAHQEGEAR